MSLVHFFEFLDFSHRLINNNSQFLIFSFDLLFCSHSLKYQLQFKQMRSSILHNPSLNMPTESYQSFDDKSETFQDVDVDEGDKGKKYEDTNIGKWIMRLINVQKRYIPDHEKDNLKNSTFYMVQIENMSEILHKKSSNGKVYLEIVANLYSLRDSTYSSRTLNYGILELQQHSSQSYKLENTLVLYFHTKNGAEDNLRVRFELNVLESQMTAPGNTQIMINEEYIGYFQIDPFKGLKSKQKVNLFSMKSNTNIQTSASFVIIVSDSFQALQKLIPPNCLCHTEDIIPGLAGKKLPSSINSLNSQIQFTELQSLKMNFSLIQIFDSLIQQKLKESLETVKHLYLGQNSQQYSMTTSIKQIRAEVFFHNGWRSVSSSSVKLQQKMEVQKKMSKKINKIEEFTKIKQFVSEEICLLPIVFLDEESIIVIQVAIRIEVKTKKENIKGSRQNDQKNIYTFVFPLGYSLYAIDKLSIDEKQIKPLKSGDAISNVLRFLESDEFKKNEKGRKFDNFGSLQFYVQLDHANKLQISRHVIPAQINKSHLELDKMMMEKERMIRENKKIKQQNRAKKIELNQEIPLLDTTGLKAALYEDEIGKIREERREKQELLEYLRKKMKEIQPNFDTELADHLEKNKDLNENIPNLSQKKGFKNLHNSIFYKTLLKQNNSKSGKNRNNLQWIKTDVIRIKSVNSIEGSLMLNGEVPLDILKTELLEQNYSYAIFLNCLFLTPITSQVMLPRKFLISTNFYRFRDLKTCACTVNQSSGLIEIIMPQINQSQEVNKKEKQKETKVEKYETEKIIYVEVGLDKSIHNCIQQFADFIGYLYHGQIQIKIIDMNSGLEFGEASLKLKDLIRMRRNQVNISRDLLVYNENKEPIAKLKIEVRCLKKQASGEVSRATNYSSKLEDIVEPQARQLQRINRYKNAHYKSAAQNLTQVDSMKLSRINKMFDQKYTKQEINVSVSRMRGQLIRLETVNRSNITESYKITLNDPDRTYANDELIVIDETFLKIMSKTNWWKQMLDLCVVKSNTIIPIDSSYCFDLNPGQGGYILLYLYTERKHEQQLLQKQHNLQPHELLKIYNHRRCVEVTLTNKQSHQLCSVYKINIIPELDCSTYYYRFVRKGGQKLQVQIPYSMKIQGQNNVLYIDDPTVVATYEEISGEKFIKFDCYAGEQEELMSKAECKRLQISILSSYPQNRLIVNYNIEFWGAHQAYLEAELWENREILLDLHSSICRQHSLGYILVLSDNEKMIKIHEKNPVKVNFKQTKTIIRATVTPNIIGISNHTINVISPIDYSCIYRFVIKLDVGEPSFREKLILKIKLTDKILEQPFSFNNELAKKLTFKLKSTKQHILWAVQDKIEVEARSSKSMKIKINAEIITETQVVVLTLKGDKISYHYMFVLELDSGDDIF